MGTFLGTEGRKDLKSECGFSLTRIYRVLIST
jgi:hypothetical protein